MSRRYIGIHGWSVGDGGIGTIGPLMEALALRGKRTVMPSYGKVLTPWGTRMKSRKFAKILSTQMQKGDIVIGHSNGGRIAVELSYYAPEIKTLILLNPALERDMVPAKTVEKCLVVHAPNDWAVWWARWIPGSIWGDMGRVGYVPRPDWPWGADERMVMHPRAGGHSDYTINPRNWADKIIAFSEE